MLYRTPRDLVVELISLLGLTNVELSEDGSCGLLFDNETNVTLEPDPQRATVLHLHAVVGSVPAERRARFYIHLLRGNYLGRATGHASLALDAAGVAVLLQLSLNTEQINVTTLGEHLTTFAKTAALWRQRLGRSEASASDEEFLSEASLATMIRV
ncbi:type III secretion system chaperone [Prosthecobacter vanneervenii]|uniref:Uncharacterized protein n=1 Tax=Prosthecobacter vanneervenii TaxID=48466 RepID=A0A7W8DIL9_9BACT|nr:type III secretion system chaperone [Prosthecobacter vanneervenii]MBB5031249.1 hypothetical protein [Prosthecobacter vanneervenii]